MVDVFDEFPREFLLFSFLFCLICCLKLDGSFFFFWIYYEMYKELFCFRNSFEYIYIIFLTRIIRLIYYNMINLNWMNKIISIFPEDTRKLVSN